MLLELTQRKPMHFGHAMATMYAEETLKDGCPTYNICDVGLGAVLWTAP